MGGYGRVVPSSGDLFHAKHPNIDDSRKGSFLLSTCQTLRPSQVYPCCHTDRALPVQEDCVKYEEHLHPSLSKSRIVFRLLSCLLQSLSNQGHDDRKRHLSLHVLHLVKNHCSHQS